MRYLSSLLICLSLALLCFSFLDSGCEKPPSYKDTGLPVEKRVDDLVSRMTLKEKVSQMVNGAAAIPRLEVPAYNWWNECLHGVARAGLATVFPQAIGLAAAWDTRLMHEVAVAISDEARAKHHEFVRRGKHGIYEGLTFWSPNINLFRDPRWGRGQETYGEDPYLTGRLAVQFIKGLQGDDPRYLKVVSTVKHFAVHSGPEPERHTFNALVSERDLMESYLPHFEASIKEGHAYSVMCAYNRFRGDACCASPFLLDKVLRNEWGFQGYIVSDCGAISDIYRNHKVVSTAPEAAALSVKSGTDLECGNTYASLEDAVARSLITEQEIDRAVKRLFTARFKLGMFDPPEMVPYTRIPYTVVDSPAHAQLALKAARESIVLLKNDRHTLPLSKKLKGIAVIGPNAADVEVLLGNYNGTPSHPVTPLQGIKDKVGAGTKVLYARGCDWAENLPFLEVIPSSALVTSEAGERRNGLSGEYFANRDFTGQPVLTRIDDRIDFNWRDAVPDKSVKDDDNFAVRWTGELVAPETGTYAIGGRGLTGFRVYLDEKLLASFESIHQASEKYGSVALEKGRSYRLRVEYFEKAGDASMQLLWSVPGGEREREEAAVKAVKQADVAVMFMGLSPRLEGEEMRIQIEGFSGGDRLTLDLPAVQERLIRKIYGLGKPIVLVLLSGSAVAVNWANDYVPAILAAWYPGQAAGEAIADVLFGDANPGGRLPVTFYRNVSQLPPFDDYDMAGRTYRYFKGEPLYPFGYGLSYTRFSYGKLTLPQFVSPKQTVPVSVEVRNLGDRAGDEVVQLYLSHVNAKAPVPLRSLEGFERVTLASGEARKVQFTLSPEQLSVIDENSRRVNLPGQFEIAVGGGQPGFAAASSTQVLTGRFEVR